MAIKTKPSPLVVAKCPKYQFPSAIKEAKMQYHESLGWLRDSILAVNEEIKCSASELNGRRAVVHNTKQRYRLNANMEVITEERKDDGAAGIADSAQQIADLALACQTTTELLTYQNTIKHLQRSLNEYISTKRS